MSMDNRQSYFDPYFDEWYDRDDPYRHIRRRRVEDYDSEYWKKKDAQLENFYAGGL